MPYNFDHLLSAQSPFDQNVWLCPRGDTADYEASHDLVDHLNDWEDASINANEIFE